MSHVPYPGCYCVNCVEGTPSARITGDKDRENPVEGVPLAKEAADRLRLWFFRECNSGTRRQLFSIFGLPLDEIRNQGAERGEVVVDSGFSAENLSVAEWLWTNLPTGNRKWHSLPTHEKALVCHMVERLREPLYSLPTPPEAV